MKTPIYETSTGATAALLKTRQFQWVGLYKIVLVGGGTTYYTTGDVPLIFGGNTYQTAAQVGAIFGKEGSRTTIKWRIGTEVDTMQFDVIPNSGTINGQKWLDAIQQGVFDGADVTFYHAYWPQQTWVPLIAPTGVVVMFAGTVAPVTAGRSSANFTINSYLDKLNQQLPRVLYQAQCVNTLYDAGCTLVASSFAVASTALTGSTAGIINATITNPTGYFDLGKITFTSGVNNGISRGIKQYIHGSPGTVALTSPFPQVPAAADTFNIYPGCDKLQTTCFAKFDNLANFRGQPYIPENSTGV